MLAFMLSACWYSDAELDAALDAADTGTGSDADTSELVAGCPDEPEGGAPDFTLVDKSGDPWSLHELCDSVVLLVFDAYWNGAGPGTADEVQDWYESYGEQGLFPIEVVGENAAGESPTAEDLATLQSEWGISYLVLADPGFETYWEFNEESSGVLPYMVLLGRGLVIVDGDGAVNEAQLAREL